MLLYIDLQFVGLEHIYGKCDAFLFDRKMSSLDE